MSESMQNCEHDLLRELLPWYVNDTLDANDRDRVSRHLVGCEACQIDVGLHQEMQKVVCADEPTPILPNRCAADLLDKPPAAFPGSNYWRTSRQLALAAGIAVVLIGAAIYLRFDLTREDANQEFVLVTDPASTTAMDYVFQIQFRDGVAASDRERIIGDLGTSIATLTDNPAIYRVTIRLEATSIKELEQYSAELRSRPEVGTVEVVARQLPMR